VFVALGAMSERAMCNCKELPSYIADPNYYDRKFQYQGTEDNSEYFQEVESEDWQPEMDFGNPIVQCIDCGQYWYFEYAPEESAFPLFGMKRSNVTDFPSETLIEEAKGKLSLLAHGGTSAEKCRIKGCENYKLNGRELCVHHISFP
jgi:hypothetical protein